MLVNILEAGLFSMLFTSSFILFYYGSFAVTLGDDIEFNVGKKSLRNARRKYKGFWKKFLFIDFKNHISKWHYFLFICFLTSFLAILISMNLLIIFDISFFKWLTSILSILYLSSFALSLFSRWSLYRGNKIRNRGKYRKNKH